MDHQYATEKYAVEQYLLGEMSLQEREEFEEHYFSCPECAEAVRAGTHFADNVQFSAEPRQAPREEPDRPTGAGQVVEMKARPRPTLWQRLSPPVGVAAAVLLAIVGYQNFSPKPSLRPELLARSVIRPVARGSGNVIQLKPGQKTAILRMDLNSDRAYPYYAVDLQTQSGKSILHQVTEAPADGALEIAQIPPGVYEVAVRGQADASGQPGPVVERSKFLVKE